MQEIALLRSCRDRNIVQFIGACLEVRQCVQQSCLLYLSGFQVTSCALLEAFLLTWCLVMAASLACTHLLYVYLDICLACCPEQPF